MKKIVFSIQLCLLVVVAMAQAPSNYRYVKTWRISEKFATVDSIPVDTTHINYQNANLIDRFSISNSYQGNLGTPIESKLYFDRPASSDFIFSNAYYPYLMNVQHATFYNTKTPLTTINYTTGGTNFRKEDKIGFFYAGNLNKRLNIGSAIDYIYAVGEYANQSVKRFAGSLFGSFNGKHYSSVGIIATNTLSNFENGGISDMSIITDPQPAIDFATKDIPVRLNGYSNYKQSQIYYNQQYSIGFERKIKVKKDSVRLEYVPVTRFGHTFKFDDLRKRYYENAADKSFYQHTYRTGIHTNDTSALQTLTNNFSVSMAEEFNKWMKFGLTAYLENEVQKYVFLRDSTLNRMLNSTTKVGAVLSKQQGKIFRYNVLGEFSPVGYKAGNFLLEGTLGGYFKLWKDSIVLVANGFVRSDKPSYFLQHYESNHFRWNNQFESVYKTHIGGTFSIPTRKFSLKIGVENITKFVYFGADSLPAQHAGNIQVVSANLTQNFKIGKFYLENNLVYQLSSQADVLPLPTLTAYHNLYFDDKWFKVLSVQMGVDVRYHTAYYAPLYMPATGQFIVQNTTKIGNYPVMSAYINCHLKRTRFFVEYYHVSQMFMKGAYFSMPNYPLNPAIVKTGISWNFYD